MAKFNGGWLQFNSRSPNYNYMYEYTLRSTITTKGMDSSARCPKAEIRDDAAAAGSGQY